MIYSQPDSMFLDFNPPLGYCFPGAMPFLPEDIDYYKKKELLKHTKTINEVNDLSGNINNNNFFIVNSSVWGQTEYCGNKLNDGLLYNPDIDRTLLINSTGILIWDFLHKPRNLEEIVDYIITSSENKPNRNVIKNHIILFIMDLLPDYIFKVSQNKDSGEIKC